MMQVLAEQQTSKRKSAVAECRPIIPQPGGETRYAAAVRLYGADSIEAQSFCLQDKLQYMDALREEQLRARPFLVRLCCAIKQTDAWVWISTFIRVIFQ